MWNFYKIRNRQAFTLIELLIVVAIIAILAAIAVPNFLEAQVRSKVSRCHADMRSLAVALESYRIDTNKYPSDFDGINNDMVGGTGTWNPFYNLRYITTPVAYITSLLLDPFDIPWDNYSDPAQVPGYDYLIARNGGTLPVEFQDVYENAGMNYQRSTSLWRLTSIGPLGKNSYGMSEPPYDPTNGTMSHGNISRFGP